MVFRQNDEWEAGYPDAGVLWSKVDSRTFNLNHPAVVAAIVTHMLENGWAPETSTSPLDVSDGFEILNACDL